MAWIKVFDNKLPNELEDDIYICVSIMWNGNIKKFPVQHYQDKQDHVFGDIYASAFGINYYFSFVSNLSSEILKDAELVKNEYIKKKKHGLNNKIADLQNEMNNL